MGIAETTEIMLRGLSSPSLALRRSVLEEALAEIKAVTTTRHPLGFYHFDVSQLAGLEFPVRLHVWTSETLKLQDQLGNRHDHVWHLTSLVLTGELSDQLLQVESDPVGGDQLVEIYYETDDERAVPVNGRVRTIVRERRRLEAGSIYKVAPGSFHQTEVSHLPTATLVLAQPGVLDGRPRIITTAGIASGESRGTKRAPVDAVDAADVLSRAISDLVS